MDKWLYLFLLSFLCGLSVQLFAQDKFLLDSLQQVYQRQPHDSVKSLLLFHLSREYRHFFPDTALRLANQGLKIARKIRFKPGIAANLNSLGMLQLNQGNYTPALKYLLEGLAINEGLGDLPEIATSKNNIGEVYRLQQNYPEALRYYQEAYQTNEKANNQKGIAINLNNIGEIYKEENKLESALSYLVKSLIICEKLKDTRRIAIRLNNIGEVYAKKNEDEKARNYFMKAQRINDSLHNQVYVAIVAVNLAKLEAKNKNREKGLEYARKALKAATSIRAKKECKDAAEVLAMLYERQGNYTLAFRNYQLFTQYKDSLSAEESARQMKEMQYEYTLVNQQKEILKLENNQKLQTQQQKTQHIYIIAFAIGVVLLVLLAILQFRKHSFERKAKEMLQEKNDALEKTLLLAEQQKQEITSQYEELHQQQEEISAQRDALEISHKELKLQNHLIQSSIQVAKVIQEAILPWSNQFEELYAEFFILYMPKNVVSGDFYWLYKQPDHHIIFVADCTGHGVPGAFMSLIGSFLLNEIAQKRAAETPAQILKELHELFSLALNQSATVHNYGMDAALCLIQNPVADTYQITYAGAKRPMYYRDKNNTSIQTIKGSRRSIGGNQNKQNTFEDYTFSLHSAGVIYLCTDGYIDQNDSMRKSYGEKKFIDLLNTYATDTLSTQLLHIREAMENYMKDTEQRDDITVLGIKLK
jgi:serine phosphatase RsbU (regulator of sigma subunit)